MEIQKNLKNKYLFKKNWKKKKYIRGHLISRI